MFIIVIQALLLFLPGYIANMMPVVFKHYGLIGVLLKPIDGGQQFFGDDLFGSHKTYLGFVSGIFGAVLTSVLLSLFYFSFPQARWIFLFPYEMPVALAWGTLCGFGALFGDLVKSFFKRRLHIKSGASFFPFDQLDFVIGGLSLAAFIYVPSWQHILVLLLLTPILHLLSNLIAYTLGMKHVWW